MEKPTNRTPLYKHRTFTDKFSDTAVFVSACWKPLLRILSTALIPLCLLQAVCDAVNMDKLFGFPSELLCSSFLQLMGSLFVIITVYATMTAYNKCSEDGQSECANLNSISASRLYAAAKPRMQSVCKILCSIVLLCAIAAVLTVAIAMTAGAMIGAFNGNEKDIAVVCVTLALLLLLALPFWVLAVPAYALDGLGFRTGLVRAIHCGFSTWGGIVAIMTVFSIAGMAIALPFALLPSYIGSFVSSYIIYIVQAVELVALGYQYGHAKAKLGLAE